MWFFKQFLAAKLKFFRAEVPTRSSDLLFDFDRDLYDGRLRLSFVQRLRDERTFPDVDALRAQIEADCRAALRLFGRISL